MKNEKLMLKLLQDLSAAVSFYFINDNISPSVLVSTLKNGKIYTSIVRYGNFDHTDYTGVKGKLVVCKAVENTLLESLKKLSDNFLLHTKYNKRESNPLERLFGTLKKMVTSNYEDTFYSPYDSE